MASLSTEPFLESLYAQGRKLPLSFEVYPPKTVEARETLRDTVARLADADPAFFSVTFSPDGSSRDRTIEVASEIHALTGRPVAAHLTAFGSTQPEIDATADRLWEAGIQRIVALRGDRPSDADAVPQAYPYAQGLVAALKRRHRFEISVAAYPEAHPESRSLEDDIEHLKAKIDAGADRAICQFTLEPAYYGRFREACEKHGITVPIVPGIIPLTLWRRVRRFALRAGTTVPAWLDEVFDGTEGEPEVLRMTAMTVMAEQLRRLVAYGAPALHFYTLNHWVLPLTAAHLTGRHIGDVLQKQMGRLGQVS